MEGEQSCFFCSAPAKEVCTYCDSQVYYCSTAHFKIHRPEKICFPFYVKSDPKVGRFMVATQNIKASGT